MAVVLASQSPQRSAILAQLGIPFRVVVPIVDEATSGDPGTLAVSNAELKAEAVALAANTNEVVLGCDTIVVVDDEIFGKPADRADAERMLRALSGRDHVVASGVAWRHNGKQGTFLAQTTVRFRHLSSVELAAYLDTEEWRGRAGGYAIQGSGSGLVRSVDGCFWNVVGFPGPALLDELDRLGIRDAAFAPLMRASASLDSPRSILRAELRSAVASALEAAPGVVGVWEGGSAAFGRVDDESDLDIQALVDETANANSIFASVRDSIAEVSPIVQSWRVPDLTDEEQTFYRVEADDLLLVDLALIPQSADDWFLQPERHGEALIIWDPNNVVATAPTLDHRAHNTRLLSDVAKSLAQAPMFAAFVGKELRRGRRIDARFVYDRLVLDPLITVLGAVYRPPRHNFGRRYLHEDLPEDIRARFERLFFAGVHELESATREASAWTIQLAEAVLSDFGITSSPERAGAAIAAGQLVGLPTETVYGLAADASNEEAVQRIFAAKDRPANSPLIVHLADASQLGEWAQDVPPIAYQLADELWPGPLTMVFTATQKSSSSVRAGGSTIAIRVPDHPVARAAISAAGTAVAAPSANAHGGVSPTRAIDVRAAFTEDAVPLVLDGGASRVGLESTILDLTGQSPRLLRLGGTSVERIEEILGRSVELAIEHLERDSLGSALVPVPGQARAHYAPNAHVELIPTVDEAISRAQQLAATQGSGSARGIVGVLVPISRAKAGAAFAASGAEILLASEHADVFGAHLYDALRAADARSLTNVLAVAPAAGEMSAAILDRLVRASAGSHS